MPIDLNLKGKVFGMPTVVVIVGGGLVLGIGWRIMRARQNAKATVATDTTTPADAASQAVGGSPDNTTTDSSIGYGFGGLGGGSIGGGSPYPASDPWNNLPPDVINAINQIPDIASAVGVGSGATGASSGSCGPGTKWDTGSQRCVPVMAPQPITIINQVPGGGSPTGGVGNNGCPPGKIKYKGKCVTATWNCHGGAVKDASVPGRCYCPKDKPFLVNGVCSKTRKG